MTLEDGIAAAVRAEVAPLHASVAKLSAEIEALRRAMPPALVTMREAARLLGLSLSTVRRRIRDGQLPARRVGKSVRVDLAGLHAPKPTEIARLSLATRAVD